MKRCFISIDFPKEIVEKIKEIQEELPNFVGKKTEEENLHLTLKFLGEIEEEKIELIKEKLSEINFDEISCFIDAVGVFSEKHVRIVWLHISGVEELQKQIDEKLGEFLEREKRFMSHVTIARVKSIRDKKKFLEEIKKIKFGKIEFSADRFFLKESELMEQGPEYKTLEIYEGEKKYK